MARDRAEPQDCELEYGEQMTVPALVLGIPLILLVIVLYWIGMWKFMGWWTAKLKAWTDSKLDAKFPGHP